MLPSRLVVAVGVCAVVWASGGTWLTAQERPQPTYRLEPVAAEEWRTRFSPDQLALLEKLNRRDVEHLKRLTAVIVPDDWTRTENDYSPHPQRWEAASALPKIIVVHQPMQVFAAYEFGQLVRWGPVSTGRKETPTPAGEYALTWRSKSRVSTDNDQWLLKWYFNFINSRGISFHEFDLPGSAASHACVRLLSRDAQWLYAWGEQWQLSPDRRDVARPGSPVIIDGVVDFKNLTPWTDPAAWTTMITLPTLPLSLPR